MHTLRAKKPKKINARQLQRRKDMVQEQMQQPARQPRQTDGVLHIQQEL